MDLSTESSPSVSEYLKDNLLALKSPTSEYKAVYFCPVFCEKSDLAIEDDVNKLVPLFRKRFGANIHKIILSSHNPRIALNTKLIELEEMDIEDCLLIFYFSAHGGKDRESSKVSIYKNNEEKSPKLEMPTTLKQIDICFGYKSVDILLLLDFCYSALALKGKDEQTIEILAACGIDETVPHGLFAQAIIDELNRMSTSLVVVNLHQQLIQRIQKGYGATPVHGMIKGNRSIRLFALDSSSSSSSPLAAAPSSSAYALVKLHFKEDLCDAEIVRIVQVLNDACGELLGLAERVEVVKTIKSNSTSLLLFLPVALVDLLVMFMDLKVLDIVLLSLNS